MTTLTAAVGMTTAPRPVPTIWESLMSLRADAGYRGPITILDDCSGQQRVAYNIHWHVNKGKLGPLLNFVELLRMLMDTGAQYIVLLEDDIIWAENAWDIMWQDIAAINRTAFLYSPYSSYTVSKPLLKRFHKLKPGLYNMNFAGKAGGSQAYVMTRNAAETLMKDSLWQVRLSAARDMPFDPTRRKANMNADRDGQVSAALMRQRVPVIYRIPSLVNHSLGSANSSYWFKPEQDTVFFEPQAKVLKNYVLHN